VAEIDLAALKANAALIAARVAPAGVMAVVKADAYGHGAMACARALAPHVWGFAVSLVEEGVELRRGGLEGPIVVLGGVYGRSHQDVVAYGLTPVVWEVEQIERFARAADELSAGRVGIHLKIDTGMARLGARPEVLPSLLEAARRVAGVEVTGLATHLAEADEADEAATRAQLSAFDEARAQVAAAGFAPKLVHAANTAGSLRFPGARHDVVRPGLALYGGLPSANVALPGLKPVMRLTTRIVALRDLPAGAKVSYGGRWRADRSSKIATIPIGYADGYTRRMSGRAEVLVAGRRCKVAGAITMDMAMVDVTDVPARLGDEVTLIGSQGGATLGVDELAAWSDTVSYEIYCGISKRVPRVYR
jgi:alanine racemase